MRTLREPVSLIASKQTSMLLTRAPESFFLACKVFLMVSVESASKGFALWTPHTFSSGSAEPAGCDPSGLGNAAHLGTVIMMSWQVVNLPL